MNGPFSTFPSKYKKTFESMNTKDKKIARQITNFYELSHLYGFLTSSPPGDAGCVSPRCTILYPVMPGHFSVWSHRQHRLHFPTENHSKRVTQEERQKQGGGGEEKRAGSPSPTPQHVYRPGSVMCPPGHQPAQTRYSIPQIQHSSDTAKVWQKWCPPRVR